MAYDFDKIARDYDRMNHLMTLGLDKCWRKRAVKELPAGGSRRSVLDVACGTGDMCLLLAKQGAAVTGVDLSEEMLAIARKKVASAKFQFSTFNFQISDAERLPFPDASFDAVTCAFGVRNFVHLERGLAEMLRVLKPGGTMAILEMATPDSRLLRPLYDLYAGKIIPWLGQHLARSREAYTYLPASISRFPKGDAFIRILQNAGAQVRNCRQRKLTFGVCRLYLASR